MRTGPDLTIEDLEKLDKVIFTKRRILSIINGFFDPMGLLSAHLIKFKILMKELFEEADYDWDTPLPEALQIKWRNMVR